MPTGRRARGVVPTFLAAFVPLELVFSGLGGLSFFLVSLLLSLALLSLGFFAVSLTARLGAGVSTARLARFTSSVLSDALLPFAPSEFTGLVLAREALTGFLSAGGLVSSALATFFLATFLATFASVALAAAATRPLCGALAARFSAFATSAA